MGVRLRPAVESTMDECVSVTKSELTTASSVYLGSDPVLKEIQ